MKDLIKKYGEEAILKTGILKRSTLEDYKLEKRKAKPVTRIAVALALGARWQDYA